MSRKRLFYETLDVRVECLRVNGAERVVHPAVRFLVPLGDRLPEAVRLVELVLSLGQVLVTFHAPFWK